MTQSKVLLQALAEAAAPLARELAAKLPRRPVPVGENPLSRNDLGLLYRELEELLNEALPALRDVIEEMADCDPEDVEELFDDLAPPALDLTDMAHRIWEAPLPREAESLRPLLAALAEEPVIRLVDLLLRILHAVINPWAVEIPEHPVFPFTAEEESERRRADLAAWRRAHPGILPDDLPL